MKSFITIALDTFLLLRRDRVFLPAIIGGIFITIFANIASNWGIETFEKILFDIGFLGYHFIGSLVAIFWGTKLISDAKQEGAIEFQLAAPISRSTWLLGKFAGLTLALMSLSLILLLIWQTLMLLNDFNIMKEKHLIVFLYFNFNWMILAALAILMSTFTSYSTALFSTLSLWLVGLTSGLVKATLSPETSQHLKNLVAAIAQFWNLQKFNFSSRFTDVQNFSRSELIYSAGYGVSLMVFFIALAVLIFRKKDLIA